MAVGQRRVGRYEIIRQIGRGGMAIVYLARQETLDREVALKELSSFHASAPEMAERFLRESRLAGSLNHPNIVTVLEYFEDSGIPYIAMEYVRRGSLRPYVGKLSMAQFAGVMEGVLAGLAHANTHGIVHRDLKPENIMVTADGRVKITDFGIAKATQSAGTGLFLTAAGTTVGTPTYMAPEQAMGSDIGIWTDLYSLGVMAWEHCVGRVPFYDSTVPMVILTRQLNEVIPPAASVNPNTDPDLSDWIDRLLIKDPRERAQSPVDVWDELEEIVITKLGPRWRRVARLPSPSQVFDTPHPLTPAPFESQSVRTPAPAPAVEDRDAIAQQDEPEQPAAPADAPAVAAATGTDGGAAPRGDSGYVTFGADQGFPTPPGAAEAAIPLAAADALTPEAPAEVEQAPAEVHPTALPREETEPAPVTGRSTYVTFGSPGPVKPVAPEAEPVAEPEELAPVAEAPVEEAPVEEPPVEEARVEAGPADAAPVEEALDGETLPGMGSWAVAPPAHEETEATVEAEPEHAALPQDAVREVPAHATAAPDDAPESVPATATATATRSGVAGRRAMLIAGLVGIAIAAILGFVVAPKSSPPPAATTPLVGSASSGPISLLIPARWQAQSAPATPGLKLANQIAVGPTGATGGELVVGTARTTDPSLLPDTLLSALSGTPDRQVVTLGPHQFYRYLGVQPQGASASESVYALPTTTAGTVLAACMLQGAGASFPSDCERVLGTLKLVGTADAGLAPSSSFGSQLSAAIGQLNSAVNAGQARLAAATRPGQQATAASGLAAAYDHAAAAVGKLSAPPTVSAAVAALTSALAKTGRDYTALAAAASHNDARAYNTARTAVSGDSGALSGAFAGLAKLGYQAQ